MSTDGLALQSFLHEDNDKQCVCLVYGCSYAAAAAGAWVHLSESCWHRSSTANSVPVTTSIQPQLIAE